MANIQTQAPPAPLPTRESMRSEPQVTLPPIRVRYFKRMGFQRVYPVAVSWRRRDAAAVPAGTEPVTLRLSAGGANVVPAEHALDPTKPDAHATFYVTPLAKGWLRQARLEVSHGGKKIQELPLRSKSVTQRPTVVLLALTILLPALITYYLRYSPFQQVVRDVRNPANRLVKPTLLTTQETVARVLRENLPSLPRFKGDPAIVGLVEQEEALDAPEFVRNGVEELRNVPDFIGELYVSLLVICQTYPVAFYAGAIFLLLTVWSLFANNPKRAKVVGEPILINRAAPRDVMILAKT